MTAAGSVYRLRVTVWPTHGTTADDVLAVAVAGFDGELESCDWHAVPIAAVIVELVFRSSRPDAVLRQVAPVIAGLRRRWPIDALKLQARGASRGRWSPVQL